uniref:T9SS type A sorting domain-containing protein n=1 Tax=candidate division WOR-3 bacterium TaxID=2052148 RepID=A0A7C4TIB1_UNCW3
MQKYLILLIFCLGFSQVNWHIENVDKTNLDGYPFEISALALDSNYIPHILYVSAYFSDLLFATRDDNGWEKEIVETSLRYFGASLAFDNNNTPHISYYAADAHLNRTYLCYAQKINGEWMRMVVDSCTGGYSPFIYHTSIDLDTNGKPGIAYMAWEAPDSLRMIKYAYFDGISWSISILTCVAIGHTLDYSPALAFDRNNGIPHIAFHRLYGATRDTVFHALHNDTLNQWIIEPAIIIPDGGEPIDMALNSRGYPCIAYGWNIALAYSWWDGQYWHTNEFTGYYIGWIGIAMALALDSLDNPHIIAHGDPITYSPGYCYKDTIWHAYYPIGDTGIVKGDISIALGRDGDLHVCYDFYSYHNDTTYLKYAWGTPVGIKEEKMQKPKDKSPKIEVYPNPSREKVMIRCMIQNTRYIIPDINLKIYDVGGRLVKQFDHLSSKQYGGIQPFNEIIWYGDDNSGKQVPGGVYFIKLETSDYSEIKKIIRLK